MAAAEEKMLSLEELKQEMFQSLRDTGTIDMIRAQVRRRFIEKLQQSAAVTRARTITSESVDTNSMVAAVSETTWSAQQKILHGLVLGYLQHHRLQHTLAVFVPEIGGVHSHLTTDTILQMLGPRTDQLEQIKLQVTQGESLLSVLLENLSQRMAVTVTEFGTQTAMDCVDHRIVLENELRRVESAYLEECANQKNEPSRSIEERMIQYQREYDALSEKRLQEELERFKTTEMGLMRVEERKRFEREADALRSAQYHEYREKLERLQERERELEMAFVVKRNELETSLFDTRQTLFQELEALRVKSTQLQVKIDTDARYAANETKRLELWEKNVRSQETNMEQLVAQSVREQEHSWHTERTQLKFEIHALEEEVAARETALQNERESLKKEKERYKAVQAETQELEESLERANESLGEANKSIVRLEREKKRLEEELVSKDRIVDDDKSSLKHLTIDNARLAMEKQMLQSELERLQLTISSYENKAHECQVQLKDLQQQMLALKMDEASAVVSERKKYLQAAEEARERSIWKEQELMSQVRDLRSHLAEAEAKAEKYQSQYDDEMIHVQSLRHEVSNLSALLAQTQTMLNAKHSTATSRDGARANRYAGGITRSNQNGTNNDDSGFSDRMLMMRMMEMMAGLRTGSTRMQHVDQFQSASIPPPAPTGSSPTVESSAVNVRASAQVNKELEEELQLQKEQRRREKELLEEREYERRKLERMQQEQAEMGERKKEFEDQLERQRRQAFEEQERLDTERRRKIEEEEVEFQKEQELKRKALEETEALQRRLTQERDELERVRAIEQQEYEKQQRLTKAQEEEAAQQRVLKLRAEEAQAERERERKHVEQEKIQQAEQEKIQQAEQDKLQEEKNEPKETSVHEQKHFSESEDSSFVPDEPCAASTENKDPFADVIRQDQVHESPIAEKEDVDIEHETKKENEISHGADDQILPSISTEEELAASESSAPPDQLSTTENDLQNEVQDDANAVNKEAKDEAAINSPDSPPEPIKSAEEEEEDRRKQAEEEKKKQDESVIDVYRQRVLARKAAEKQRQAELEEQARREEEEAERERQRLQEQLAGDSDQEDEAELSGGSFAESSAGASSDSF